jgi:hypothetical protein
MPVRYRRILRMPLEIVVALAAFVAACLLRRVAGRRTAAVVGPKEEARRFIDARIDEHIDSLAAKHLQASPGGVGDLDDIPPRFANDIQAFIAGALLRDVVVATGDEDVADAVRELVVLERGYIYGRIIERIQAQRSAV